MALIATRRCKSLIFFYRWLIHSLYRIYAELHDQLTIDRDQTPIPPIPCQICGGMHTE